MNKPVKPQLHGIIDYAFAVALAAIPELIHTEKKGKNLYKLLAGQVALYSALTKYKPGLLPLLSLKTHRTIDILNLSCLGLLTASRLISKHTPTLAFHLVLTSLGVANVIFTDWEERKTLNRISYGK